MKEIKNIGDKMIVLVSDELKNELDMDTVTSIDHSNLYGEIATCSVLLNKVGLLRAEAESIYESAKLEASVYEAELSRKFRRQSLINGGKVKTEEGLLKLTESSLKEVILSDVKYQAVQKDLIAKKKQLAEIDSLYWALQSKDRKLTNLVPKVTPEEFVEKLVEGRINTFLITKEK